MKREIAKQTDQFRTVKETANRFDVCLPFLYSLINSGELTAVRFGRIVRVSEAEIQRYIAAHKIEAPITRGSRTKTKKRAA